MGLFKDIFGDEEETQSKPWGPTGQRIKNNYLPYLDEIFEGGPQEFFGGDTVADLTPEQQQALQDATGYATGQGRDIANQLLGAGQDALGGTADAMSGYQQFAGQGGPDAFLNQGPDLGLVDSLINNDVLNGQIQAATRPIERSLMEQALPGISDQFAGGSNAGSSRRGVAEGIATRGAIESAQDVAGRMRGAAYADALGIGARTAGQNSQAQNANQQANLQRQMGALGGLAGIGGQGAGMISGGNSIYGNLLNTQLQAGNVQQGQNQNEINQDVARHNFEQQAPYALADWYGGSLNAAGQGYGTQTTTGTPSPWSAAVGVGSALAGMPMLGSASGAQGSAFMGGGNLQNGWNQSNMMPGAPGGGYTPAYGGYGTVPYGTPAGPANGGWGGGNAPLFAGYGG